jgi:DNA-binding transcriptional ArsR family regulator
MSIIGLWFRSPRREQDEGLVAVEQGPHCRVVGLPDRRRFTARHESMRPGGLLAFAPLLPNARLDVSFAALSDATRRGVLEQLGRADASITDLAQTFHMTLTGMKKHVCVLEQGGLVTTEKVGRVRTCRLGPRRLEDETAWIERYRQLWDSRFDELDKFVEELHWKEKVHGGKNLG